MVAFAFLIIIMAIISFFVALFFMVLSIVLQVVFNRRKKKGKNTEKHIIVITNVVLIISTIVLIITGIPVSNMWSSNISRQAVKAESGKIIYWDDSYYNSFYMDGIKYIRSDCEVSEKTFKRGKPVANIRNKSYDEILSAAFRLLFADDDTQALYPIVTDKGFQLYNTLENIYIYCPENQKDSVLGYYNNISNYDTQNCIFEYEVFDETYKTTKIKNVILKLNVFEKIYLVNDRKKLETVQIPEKYLETMKLHKPDTSTRGYEFGTLCAYSKDGAIRKKVGLHLLDGQIYLVSKKSYEYIEGCRLPDDLNQYLIGTIFQ